MYVTRVQVSLKITGEEKERERECQAHFQKLATRDQHSQNLRKGGELRTFTEDGTVGNKRHSERSAIKLKQTQKATEMNQADARTSLAMEFAPEASA